MAADSVFSDLLSQLAATHDSVLMTNDNLRAENCFLREQLQDQVDFSTLQVGCASERQVLVEDSSSTPLCFQCAAASMRSADPTTTVIQVPAEREPLNEEDPNHSLSSPRAVAAATVDAKSLVRPRMPAAPQPAQGAGRLPPQFASSLKDIRTQSSFKLTEPTSPSTLRGDRSCSRFSTKSFSKEVKFVPKSPSSSGMVSPIEDAHREAGYVLWPLWQSSAVLNLQTQFSSSQSKSSVRLQTEISTVRGGDQLRDAGCLQRFVVGPNSKSRITWDAISMFVVSYDVLTVPLTAFNGLDTAVHNFVGRCTTVFWTCDIPLSFFSGFYSGGVVEMRPKKTARQYARTWFLADLLIVLTDWMLILLQSGLADLIGIVRITKTIRLARILRLFRLLRVIKIPVMLDEVLGEFQSETILTVFGVCRSLALIAVVNHFIACGWYATSAFTASPRWLDVLDDEKRGFGYRYLTALHWSLTQFTPASMEVVPLNTAERLYTIIIIFCALVTFSTFVSSITTAMTTLRRINTERSRQKDNIRRYVTENQLSIGLGNKINHFLRSHKVMAKRRVHEEDVHTFKCLPETMRLQLHWEVYSGRLTPHPFFHHYKEVDEQGLFEVCHRAMSELSLGMGHPLFSYGETADKVYFTLSGELEYYHAQRESEAMNVSSGQWFCEVVIWIKWEHQGRLSSLTPCEFVALDASGFRKIASRRPLMLGACRAYAEEYRQRMLAKGPDHPTDVWCDFDETQEMAHVAYDQVQIEGGHQADIPAPVSVQRPLNKLWRSWSPSSFIQRLKPAKRCNTL